MFTFLQYCINNAGILVEIQTKEKQDDLSKFLAGHSVKVDHFWIGLRRYECWVWNSDTPVCYKNWIEKHSNKTGGFS